MLPVPLTVVINVGIRLVGMPNTKPGQSSSIFGQTANALSFGRKCRDLLSRNVMPSRVWPCSRSQTLCPLSVALMCSTAVLGNRLTICKFVVGCEASRSKVRLVPRNVGLTPGCE